MITGLEFRFVAVGNLPNLKIADPLEVSKVTCAVLLVQEKPQTLTVQRVCQAFCAASSLVKSKLKFASHTRRT